MSYKIEITAGTMTELAGKLLAMAATMQTTPSDPVMPEVREAIKPAKKAKPTPVKEEVGNEPAADAVGTASSESDTATVQPETSESSETSKSTDVSSANSGSVEPEQAPGAKALDFEKDIAPLVLKVVAERGKPVVQDILAQFGVERASQVPDEQLNELVAVLKDAL